MTMEIIKNIKRFFFDEEYNKMMDEIESVDSFMSGLEERGFVYNSEKQWWQRIWTTRTKTGVESSMEVYKKEDDKWISMMFGNDGELFYQQTVGTRTDGYTTI